MLREAEMGGAERPMIWEKNSGPVTRWLTTELINDGAAARITGRHLKPGWEMAPWLIWGAALLIATYVRLGPGSLHVWWALPVGMVLLSVFWSPLLFALLLVWYFPLRKRLEILLDHESVTVGGRSYQKIGPAAYYIDQHHKVIEAVAKGRLPDKTFRKAIEVIMEQAGSMVVIAEMRAVDFGRAQGLVSVLSGLEKQFMDVLADSIRGQGSEIEKTQPVRKSAAT